MFEAAAAAVEAIIAIKQNVFGSSGAQADMIINVAEYGPRVLHCQPHLHAVVAPGFPFVSLGGGWSSGGVRRSDLDLFELPEFRA
jgi:hypothetical protein